MTYNIEDLSAKDVTFLALAVDFFLCNASVENLDTEQLTRLLVALDLMATDLEEQEFDHVLSIHDNVIEVDFSKN